MTAPEEAVRRVYAGLGWHCVAGRRAMLRLLRDSGRREEELQRAVDGMLASGELRESDGMLWYVAG